MITKTAGTTIFNLGLVSLFFGDVTGFAIKGFNHFPILVMIKVLGAGMVQICGGKVISD